MFKSKSHQRPVGQRPNVCGKRRALLAGSVIVFLLAGGVSPLLAIGTYAEGQAVIQLTKFESSGIVFESYEGTAVFSSFNPAEKCNEDENECYAPLKENIAVSVRPESADAVNYMLAHIGQEMLIRYRIHRVEALALKTDFEILEAGPTAGPRPADLSDQHTAQKSGARRNFSIRGKILRLEERGTVVKTFEGLYLDLQRGKVHPFSITNSSMAEHAFQIMRTGQPYFLGVTEAYVTGFRESNYDIFEINRNDPAGRQSGEADTN